MRRILLLITACLALTAQAQDSLTVCKFGYFSYGQMLQSMPQYAIVQKQLTTLREQYDAELKRVEDEFNRKYEEFLEGQRDFPKTILQKRQNELQELMTRNIAFKENSRQELAKAEKEAAKKSKNSIGSKVLKSVLTAITGVAAGALADKVSGAVTGKKTTSKTSTTQKAVTKATKSATTTLTRELTRSILGNLIK
jgi:outer membrane protein